MRGRACHHRPHTKNRWCWYRSPGSDLLAWGRAGLTTPGRGLRAGGSYTPIAQGGTRATDCARRYAVACGHAHLHPDHSAVRQHVRPPPDGYAVCTNVAVANATSRPSELVTSPLANTTLVPRRRHCAVSVMAATPINDGSRTRTWSSIIVNSPLAVT